MYKLFAFAKFFYHNLPLPVGIKEKLKVVFFPLFFPPETFSTKDVISKQDTELDRKDRKQKLLSHIFQAKQTGLEIGPLSTPIVTKAESNGRIFYIDYATADKLRQVYRNEPSIKTDDIVEPDYIWGSKSLAELVDHKHFDYVLASHVIEHVPDMFGWLREVAEVLEDKGVLSLAVPDKRYTFDCFRELSTPGMFIEAFLIHRRRPGIQSIFDYVALTGNIDLEEAWKGTVGRKNFRSSGTVEQAFRLAKDSLNNDYYHDVHVSVFTPASFLDLLELAIQLDLLDFTVIDFYDTAHNTLEFFASLERLPRNLSRQEALVLQLASIAKAREQLN